MGIRDEAESKCKLYSYTIPMLKKLKELRYKIGLISNSTIFAIEKVRKKTNLLDLVDYPLFSFDVGVIKPDPEFFTKMLEISGCKPEETIMIGDKLNDDVIPPKRIGMNAIHYKNYEQLKQELASFSVML